MEKLFNVYFHRRIKITKYGVPKRENIQIVLFFVAYEALPPQTYVNFMNDSYPIDYRLS